MFFLSIPTTPGPLDATCDFYLQSVKKGSCSSSIHGSSVTLTTDPGFTTGSTVELQLKAGQPRGASFTPKGKATVQFDLGPKLLFSPTQPDLLSYLLSEYDLHKKGFQSLPAIDLVKGKPREIRAELFRTRTRSTLHGPMTMREWRLESPPTAEAVIWTDLSNRPLHWWVPSQNFEIVRRGFEDLRPSFASEKKVSPPRFASKVERSVSIPMRDGTALVADVYRPEGPGRFPVILQRTCYDRTEFGIADGEFYSQRGYVYVTENVRGRGGSGGKFEPELHEAEDGYDTLAWCGSQPWSTGKVGMLGASYNAYCAWMAAKTRPKWLKMMISVVPMPSPPVGEPWPGGAHYVGARLSWFGLLRDKNKVQLYNDDMTAAENTLPIAKAAEVQFGHDVPEFDRWIHQDRYGPEVRKASYREEIGKIDLPVLYLDGWLDTVGIGTSLNYAAMVKHGARNQKLVWGPWNHFTNRQSSDGVTDYSPDGYIDMRTLSLRWFDKWLKGIPNGIDQEPAVSQFVLGENRWYQSRQWPPSNSSPQKWYLHPAGRLDTAAPTSLKPSHYTYDPAKFVYSNDFQANYFFSLGYDAASICKKPGQLMFDSAPLKKAIRLDGRIRGRVYAATTAQDTDWVMTLLDVHPDGVAVPIQCGYIRARYRHSFAKPELLKPNEVFGYDLDLWQAGIRIPAGHRLRVAVGSTLFPDMDRNLNTGEPVGDAVKMVVAKQTIYHDPLHRSYIELPVLEGGIVSKSKFGEKNS